ncbi:hypothetical protein GGH19_002395 [Coemansia sp. RSA 1807]|nr:hypothetical protein IW142_002537 [Coemansia sp. RSA 564]KAJ2181344.1 hypothetical protein GGF45_001570 [Coemansia sp. RSA 551]KAJ2186870.1 hypothetical protein EV181_003069 [Coemansia sp. RSA 532]KAJ2256864.1 hypothetical protein GGH98_001232 [Coemansia sp. RSA 454]KAJ2292511.1 hypothetical protein IW141_001887 [Coemansia sp. RSA 355]KAJ2407909.1 hypothetical protein J3F80_002485 [Coemansia sp. RSA 2526]KAJ2576176.1 hypothetical protein GGH19_002395 [Coemansia sp. RSA 1807]
MKVPFFRTKGKADSSSANSKADSGRTHKTKVVSDTEETIRPSMATLTRAPYSSPSVSNIGGQLHEMQGFLGRINGFQDEAQKLFPENTSLNQMLNELRDECQRRVDYMTRVSAPAWTATALTTASAPTPATNGRRSTVAAMFRRGAHSTATDTSSGSEHNDTSDYFAQPRANTARRAVVSSSSSNSASPPASPARPAQRPQAATVTQRDARVADRRRKVAPQSMFVIPGMTGDGSHANSQRGSLAISASEAPRLPRIRTASMDAALRPQSMAEGMASMSSGDVSKLAAAQTGSKGSLSTARTPPAAAKSRSQYMPAVKASNDYVMTIKLGGSKLEAAVSSGLQTSLVSTQLAAAMGLHVTKLPASIRVWNSSGKSWLVVGEVVAMPFACGNMAFTHNFKVVQGSSPANDMTRDIVLGNDFCIGNKGRIKDNRLHLENLAMPISVPVRQVSAA